MGSHDIQMTISTSGGGGRGRKMFDNGIYTYVIIYMSKSFYSFMYGI